MHAVAKAVGAEKVPAHVSLLITFSKAKRTFPACPLNDQGTISKRNLCPHDAASANTSSV